MSTEPLNGREREELELFRAKFDEFMKRESEATTKLAEFVTTGRTDADGLTTLFASKNLEQLRKIVRLEANVRGLETERDALRLSVASFSNRTTVLEAELAASIALAREGM